MSPADRQRLLDEEAARRGQAVNNTAMSGRNPSVVARSARLAKVFGIAPAAVEADPEPFEQQFERTKVEDALAAYPWMTPPLAGNDTLAAIAKGDDLAKTGAILSAFGMAKPDDYQINLPRQGLTSRPLRAAGPERRVVGAGRPNYLGRVVKTAGAMIGTTANQVIGTVAGGAEAATDMIGLDDTLDPFFRQLEQAKTESDAGLQDEISGWVNTDTKRGAFSAGVSLMAMGSSAALGGGKAVLPLLTAMTFGNAYTKYQGRDASVGASLLGAGVEGAIEYATERLPMGYLTSKLGKGTAKDFLTQYVLSDTIGEQIATAGQSLTDAMIAPEKPFSFKEWANDPARLSEAYQTLVASTVMSAAAGGGGFALKRLVKTEADAIDTVDALTGQTLLDDAMTGAAAVELRAASPDEFAKFVAAGAASSPVKHVYIPIEAIDAAMADETLPEEEKAALRFYQDQIEEARLNNGEVVIPIGDALASFAGTKVWQSLKDDARVLAGGISGREAREKMEALTQELEEIGNQAIEEGKAAAPQLAAKAQVYRDVKAQMVAAGRSDKEAQTTAALFASRAETLATERYGQFADSAAAWKWMQLQIVGADAKPAKGKRGKKVAQGGKATLAAAARTKDVTLRLVEGPVPNMGGTTGDTMWVDWIESKRKGAGTEAMTKLVAEADRQKIPLALNVDDSSGDPARLREFYARFGFVPDPAGGPEMVRSPDGIAEDEAGFPLEDGMVSEGDGTTDPMTLQQFGGRKAVLGLSAQSRMMQAQELEAQGYDEQHIWNATGWLRGADGKWRFEISDLLARIKKLETSARNEQGQAVSEFLETVLHHPKLYFHYPQLARLPVISVPMTGGVRGYFGYDHIAIADDASKEEALSTLLHEIQHAIQYIEGFTNGATNAPAVLEKMGLGNELRNQIEYFEAINNGEVPGWSFPEKATPEQIEATAAQKIYMRVLGEAEARTVQRRASWTAADRAETFPDFAADLNGEGLLVPERNIQDTGAAAMSQGPRGEATFFPSGKTVVQLFGKADFSTMLHEMSHVFLQQEFTLAQSDKASAELKADIAALTAWFEKNGGKLDAKGMPDREAHELFARTGERYFREGKAPSAELRSAFTQFKTWLKGVYESIKDLTAHGAAPINPEIREIMDRMIATQEAIDANATAPMSQEDLGMTTAEYDAYLDSVSTARDAAHDTLLERMMKAIRNREKGRIRDQRAIVRAEVAEEVNADPRFVALHLLRTGRWLGDPAREAVAVKIHTGWLIDNYGEEVLNRLPVGLQPLHRGDGAVGDDIAAMVGMPSGDALVQALLELKVQADQLKADGNPRPLRDQIIEDETNRIMAERHGDIAMSDAEIEEEAIAALNSARQGEVLATELRQLKKLKGAGGVVTPYQLLREWARRKVNEGTVADAVSKTALQRYIRGFNKARNAFEKAILASDNNEAIKQKQAQMINHALLAEGKVVADEINKIVRRMKRYAAVKAMASIDQDYMDRIHELLEAYSFRNVSDRQRADQASFETWAEGQRAQGHEVYVPPRFRDERTNYKDARVAKLLELNDMVQSLAAQGKLKQRLLTAQGERELAATVDDVESRILNLPPRTLPDSSTGDENKPFMQAAREDGYRRAIANLFRPGSRVRETAAGLVKIEGLFDILDGTKDGTGPLNQNVLRGATDAANLFSSLTEEVMEPIIARYKAMSRKQSARLRDFVTINELTLNQSIHEADQEKLGQPLTIPRMKLIGLLLNTGNLSNLGKLVAGERWGDPESAADMARVRDILVSYASKEDLDLVQDIWNGVSKLWPHIARVERELSGVVPEEVVPMGFDTPHGPYTGGYWPVVWDSTRSQMGKKQGEEAETSLQGVGFGIATPKGHTITRTGAAAPMEWSVEHVLFGHMNKVISRIAYAPWVRDTLKIVDNQRVTGAIRLRLGTEYVKAIKPWIRDQIPSNTPDVQGAKSWERILNQVRVNMSICVLGVSYTTGMAQTLGVGYSAGVLGDGSVKDGGKWMGLGILKTLQLQKKSLGGAQEFVFARSEEMRRRAYEVSQESAEVFRRLRDQDTPVRKLQAAAFWHIGFIDLNMVAIPTWMGGYHKALAQGLTEAEAIDYAEKVVRLSQSSGRQKDLSAIQRGNAGQKFISMFYTPSSVFFNQQWEAAQHVKAGNWSKALAPTFWFLAMTTIAEAMMSGDWPEDDDKDGIDLMDSTEWAARNMAFGMFYGVPIVRDVSNTAERQLRGEYAEYGSTPLSFAMQTVGRGLETLKKTASGEELEGKDVKAGVAAVGFVFGLPGNQVGKTSGYIKDVYDGRASPNSIGDWYEGLTSGKQSAE